MVLLENKASFISPHRLVEVGTIIISSYRWENGKGVSNVLKVTISKSGENLEVIKLKCKSQEKLLGIVL